MRNRKEEKYKKMFKRLMDKEFREYRGVELWNKVHTNENDIETIRKSQADVLQVLNAIWNHPTFDEYRSKPGG